MVEQVVIDCEDGNIVIDVDYDKVGKGADLNKLDYDLMLISNGKLDVELPKDTYDYDNHKWETPKGKMIGMILEHAEAIERAMELCQHETQGWCDNCGLGA